MTKNEAMMDALQAGWCSAQSLAAANGWLPHTLRAAIAVQAKKSSLKIARKRENGITFYKVDHE